MATTACPDSDSILATQSKAYATLITRASYLPGVIILAHSLKGYGSKNPLVVLYTQNLDKTVIRALELEAEHSSLVLRPCDLLLPPSDTESAMLRASYEDTWTKLRVFEILDYDVVCFLDADMMMRDNMDSVFSSISSLPKDYLAAVHDCTCNVEQAAWAPNHWCKEGCAFTPLSHPDALTCPIQPTGESIDTHHILNSGMFFFRPSEGLRDRLLEYFNTTDQLSAFKKPDEDFLNTFFRNQWISLPWQYNARQRMRHVHEIIWKEESVVCMHYNGPVKPWTYRPVSSGEERPLHQWWWDEYEGWRQLRVDAAHFEVLEIVSQYVVNDDDLADIAKGVSALSSSSNLPDNLKSTAMDDRDAMSS